MNYRIIGKYIGFIMIVESIFMLPAIAIGLWLGEYGPTRSFAATITFAVLAGLALARMKSKQSISMSEGFVICAAGWLVMSVIGALPFYISGAIPHFVDAFFESVSGFTTTGSSILTVIEGLPLSILYWRSFTHWIGGMGVLVFLLAIVPLSRGNGQPFNLMRAESPGPSVGKLTPKIGETAKITYLIYLGLTVLMIVTLKIEGLPLFDSVVNAFATAGTGGFSIRNNSIAYYDSKLVHFTIGVFMSLFGVNFSIYYLLLTRRFKDAFRNEEFRLYWLILFGGTTAIALNIIPMYAGKAGQAFLDSFFTVSSIMTTTGFCTANFNLWPAFSKLLLLVIMMIGACAGSTGGGMKVSRLLLIIRYVRAEMSRIIRPRRTSVVLMDGNRVEDSVMDGTAAYFAVYFMITVVSILLVSFDEKDLVTTISSVICTFNNIGPGLEEVGAIGNFAAFSDFSKIVLAMDMLLGRLEIFPILVLFSPGVWLRKPKREEAFSENF